MYVLGGREREDVVVRLANLIVLMGVLGSCHAFSELVAGSFMIRLVTFPPDVSVLKDRHIVKNINVVNHHINSTTYKVRYLIHVLIPLQ